MSSETFTYKGISAGKYVEGTIEALSQDEANFKLKEQKIIITNISKSKKKAAAKKKSGGGSSFFKKKVKPEDVVIFSKQFATMVKAGLPILNVLGMLRDQLEHPELKIIVEEIDFHSNPIGTGPFKFQKWKKNEKLVLRKFENYFEKFDGKRLPFLDGVAITFLRDKQAGFLQFIMGKADFLSGIDASYKDELLTKDGSLNSKYKNLIDLQMNEYLNTAYLGFLMEDTLSPTKFLKIRQAINYGFDRRKMLKFLRNNIGTPAENGFIPKGLAGFDSIQGYSYNPEKARALINTYKQTTGATSIQVTIGTNSQYLDLCEYIQRELEKLGISIKIDVMPPATLRQLKSSGELDIFRASWVADYPDAENYLSLFYSPNFTPNGPNYTHFKNEVFDSLYVEAQKISQISKRKLLYTQMDSIVISQAPIVPLYYDIAVRFVSKKITGLGINPQNFLVLKKVKKAK